MEASATSGKINLTFGWKGPTSCNGGQDLGGFDVGYIELVFQKARTAISVTIPKNISPSTVQELPFTCRKLGKETHPDSLNVTVEQICNLTIEAGIFAEIPNSRKVKLEIPKLLEIGQTYKLVVSSSLVLTQSVNLSLTASLIKEEAKQESTSSSTKSNTTPITNDFQRRMREMGAALIQEGMNNLNLAANGGGDVFNSSSTNADVFAHVMQGVIRSGQKMNPEVKVPYTKPIEAPEDLNKLTTEELQKRFEETFIRDKKFESLRMKASMAGNLEEMNRIIQAEHANSQLLIHLGDALERKGITPQIPQSEAFQSVANQAIDDHVKKVKQLQENCNQQ